MTHEDAVNSRAVEKYLLSELAAEERAQFEEHFFDCPECAADVRVGEIFASNARAVFSEKAGLQPTPRPANPFAVRGLPDWLRPALGFAFALVIVLAVMNWVLLTRLSRLEAPQSYPAFFLHGTARGDDQVLSVPRTVRFVGVALDVPPGRRFPKYRCILTDASGRRKLSADLPAPVDPDSVLNVLMPASDLVSGRYNLVLGGIDGTEFFELGRYPFQLRLQ
jgi:Putative zinc-finger